MFFSQLTLAPVLPAIAAGNCVLIKPSEVSSLFFFFGDRIRPNYSKCPTKMKDSKKRIISQVSPATAQAMADLIPQYLDPATVRFAHGYTIHTVADAQGDFICGASPQADFILNYFLSDFLVYLQVPQISSQILNFFPAWLAGWNN